METYSVTVETNISKCSIYYKTTQFFLMLFTHQFILVISSMK